MTTARITSLSPQVYQATLQAAKEVMVEERVREPDPQRDAASSGSAKAAGVGAVVDIMV